VKRFVGVTAPSLLLLAGCLSAPVPERLADVDPITAPEPLRVREIVRLSNAGISDDVIVGLIRSRGVADRPSVAELLTLGVSLQVQLTLLALPAAVPERRPGPRIVYRELFVPVWPSYSHGYWHLGLRIGCYYRTEDGELKEVLPREPETSSSPPRVVDP
jgi:hypothetical protein